VDTFESSLVAAYNASVCSFECDAMLYGRLLKSVQTEFEARRTADELPFSIYDVLGRVRGMDSSVSWFYKRTNFTSASDHGVPIYRSGRYPENRLMSLIYGIISDEIPNPVTDAHREYMERVVQEVGILD
jgi:hypothetical protein